MMEVISKVLVIDGLKHVRLMVDTNAPRSEILIELKKLGVEYINQEAQKQDE